MRHKWTALWRVLSEPPPRETFTTVHFHPARTDRALFAFVPMVPRTHSPMSLPSYYTSAEEIATEHGVLQHMWASGLCSSFFEHAPNSFMATLCPCVSMAQISSRIRLDSYAKTLVFFGVVAALKLIGVVQTIRNHEHLLVMKDLEWTDEDDHTETPTEFFLAHNRWTILTVIFSILFVVYMCRLRYFVRRRFFIPGSLLGDCGAATFWPCCTIAQMAFHVKSYSPHSCSVGPVDSLPPFPYY